jgi:hypothetical protein
MSLILVSVGQTPRKLFSAPHPQRLNHGLATLPIGVLYGVEEDPHLLVQDSRCFKGARISILHARCLRVTSKISDLGPDTPVRELALDVVGEKILPCPEGALCAPLHPHEQVEWCPGETEMRVVVDQKVTGNVLSLPFCASDNA